MCCNNKLKNLVLFIRVCHFVKQTLIRSDAFAPHFHFCACGSTQPPFLRAIGVIHSQILFTSRKTFSQPNIILYENCRFTRVGLHQAKHLFTKKPKIFWNIGIYNVTHIETETETELEFYLDELRPSVAMATSYLAKFYVFRVVCDAPCVHIDDSIESFRILPSI